MSKLTGTRLTDRDIEMGTQREVRQIVRRLVNGEIDPPDAIRQLTDWVVRAANAMRRLEAGKGVEQ